MKCGNCKLWNSNAQLGMSIRDCKLQYKLFGKCIGFCKCKEGMNYPMFNFEVCPKTRRKKL